MKVKYHIKKRRIKANNSFTIQRESKSFNQIPKGEKESQEENERMWRNRRDGSAKNILSVFTFYTISFGEWEEYPHRNMIIMKRKQNISL